MRCCAFHFFAGGSVPAWKVHVATVRCDGAARAIGAAGGTGGRAGTMVGGLEGLTAGSDGPFVLHFLRRRLEQSRCAAGEEEAMAIRQTSTSLMNSPR